MVEAVEGGIPVSFRAVSNVFDLKGLTPTEKLVLLAYANYCDEDGRCYPRQTTVALKVGVARQTVNRTTAKLEEKGLLRVESKKDPDGRQLSNTVILTLGARVSEDDTAAHLEGAVSQRVTPGVSQGDSGYIEESIREPTKKKRTASPVLLPHGKRFARCWSDWVQHRTEIRKKLTPTSVKQQLNKLGALSETDACAMIEHTISMGWQGLRPPETARRPGETQRSGNPATFKPKRRKVADPVDESLVKELFKQVNERSAG